MKTTLAIAAVLACLFALKGVRADDYYGGQFGGMSSGFSGMGAGLGGGHMMGGGYSGFGHKGYSGYGQKGYSGYGGHSGYSGYGHSGFTGYGKSGHSGYGKKGSIIEETSFIPYSMPMVQPAYGGIAGGVGGGIDGGLGGGLGGGLFGGQGTGLRKFSANCNRLQIIQGYTVVQWLNRSTISMTWAFTCEL